MTLYTTAPPEFDPEDQCLDCATHGELCTDCLAMLRESDHEAAERGQG